MQAGGEAFEQLQADEQPTRPQRRRGCAVAAGLVLVVFGVIFYLVFGVPFDGWSRMNESRFLNNCIAEGGTESFCSCLIDRLQADGVSPDEIDRNAGARAGFVCGVQGNL